MQSRGSYRLTMRQGPVPGKVFELVKDMLTIGRDVSNDVVINDAEVSRNHARLTGQSGGYLIEDLASTNGTFVNGQRLIGPKLLNPGDVVGLGETVVLEYAQMADAGATVIASPRMVEDFATTPPRPPEPAPMPMSDFGPGPTMVEPARPEPVPVAPPPPVSPAYADPVPPPPMGSPAAPPPPAARRDNRPLVIGGVCGCLTLCTCAALAAFFVPWADLLAGFGF